MFYPLTFTKRARLIYSPAKPKTRALYKVRAGLSNEPKTLASAAKSLCAALQRACVQRFTKP
jgi:hypothetical protein